MANESQEDLARYYQGLANDAQSQADTLAKTEAAGLVERKRIADQIASLNRQQQTAITQADRDRIDNSIRVQTNNLQKTDSGIAQLQQQRNTALQQVTANQNLAKEAVGGPPAAQNIAGPAQIPAPPAAAPSTIPVTPAATPVASTQSDGEFEGVTGNQRFPQPAPPQDFVTEEDGTFIPADSSRAAERRAEIAAEEARGRTDAPAPVAGSAIEQGGEADAQAALAVRNAEAAAADDPFETARLAREAEEPPPTFEAEDLEDSPYEIARQAGEEEGDGPTLEAEDLEDSPYEIARLAGEEGEPPPTFEAEDLEDSPYEIARQAGEEEGDGPTLEAPAPVPDTKYDDFGNVVPNTPEAIAAAEAKAAEQRAAEEQAAAKLSAINQATLQSLYKAVGSSDWRVRLQLAPSSNYLYNVPVNQETGEGPGILAPLTATNGVIFPYTPAINTSYKANYEQYDLVHSNYRGVYYKNSRVDDLNIRGTFTAQDTNEANYLLAVIHFFRSVTKMFYGKDAERGTPPPLVYLSGFGMNQFYGHPCVVSNFQYNLPDNVDYIRATSVNNYGTDLLSRRTASSPSSAAGLGATGNRILNAGLEKFFPASKPAPNAVVASVNNTQLANYVPTKLEIDITLIPVQTRSQVSKQFSLKGFANGDLIKGGFW